MTPDEIESLLASPDMALAQALADEDQELLHGLVQLRRSLGMTQAAVATLMGVSQAAVSQFERIGNDPRLSTVRRYARAVGAVVRHRIDRQESGGQWRWTSPAVPDTVPGAWVTQYRAERMSPAKVKINGR